MFIDSVEDIERIAGKTGTSVFVVPDGVEVKLPQALILVPEEKSVITIEQVREVLRLLNVKQTAERFVMIRPAEALGEEAANAILKNLEEPGEKVHFVLVTGAPSRLLATILSRAAVYFLKTPPDVNAGVMVDERVKMLAKQLMTASQKEIVAVAEEICKKKDGVRAYALTVLAAAIEISYKSYFITGKMAFVAKLPGLIAAYEAVERNGHVKLQLVANLI